MAGAHAAFAVMAGLRHRRRTGEGQLIELAQAECAGGMLAQAFMDYALNGVVGERMGNGSVDGFAPYGVYPCRSEGDGSDGGDRWIAISVMDEGQWSGLKAAMGGPSWAEAAGYGERGGRLADREAIDERLGEWTSGWEDYELFHHLQGYGVPAAPVLDSSRVLEDAHVLGRGLNEWRTLYGGVGPFRFNGPFYRFSGTPVDLFKAPVALGEDNEYVYGEVLGYSGAEIEGFRERGHIGMDYDADIV